MENIIENLDLLMMITSWCYVGLFFIVYLVILIKTRILLPRTTINFVIFLVFMIFRGVRDTLYYQAY